MTVEAVAGVARLTNLTALFAAELTATGSKTRCGCTDAYGDIRSNAQSSCVRGWSCLILCGQGVGLPALLSLCTPMGGLQRVSTMNFRDQILAICCSAITGMLAALGSRLRRLSIHDDATPLAGRHRAQHAGTASLVPAVSSHCPLLAHFEVDDLRFVKARMVVMVPSTNAACPKPTTDASSCMLFSCNR